MKEKLQIDKEKENQEKKCPKCGKDLEYISSCCKAFWYCRNCDEIIGDIENAH